MQPQKPLKKLVLSAEDLAKIRKRREREDAVKVDDNWMFIGEFGYYYGFEGVRAVINNEIDFDTAQLLLQASRKVWAGKVYDLGRVGFIGSTAANAKKPTDVFNKNTKDLLKDSRPDKI